MQVLLPLRLVYFGSPDFAVPALIALAERPDLARVVAAVSQPDKPQGRGQVLTPPAVKTAALRYAIPVLQPKTLRDAAVQAELRALDADLFVVAAYGKLLPREVLDLPRLGCVNLHASLLPRHRGASPVAHALLEGDAETGVCLMGMEEGLDTGPVFARVVMPITDEDDAGTLTDRLAQLGAELLIENLAALASGTLAAVPQPAQGATYAKKLSKEDGHLAWNQPAVAVVHRIRALTPWPSAFAFLDTKRLQILRARVAGDPGEPMKGGLAPPGTLQVDGKRLFVACGAGSVEILTLKPEGKRSMSVVDYLSGRPPFHAGAALS